MNMAVRSKVWIEIDGEVVLSQGKASLLEAIQETGSLQKAADRMGMSYRHAWGIIQKMEHRSRKKLVITKQGRNGGGSVLTPEARDWLLRFNKFHDGLRELVDGRFNSAFGDIDLSG
ncbi:MAG: LysR family transcriptional regulator [Deltaproteobacteria bacterium]|nr:LysR family transcriptional regulator [Deltaproteobacteria bacterium]MBW2307648.1 LysR family transcriptional regulator [Deltaproteobacteria bacterium]